nr:hypothetical protein HmN_000968800 [Hymenolepis microstoma]
MTSQTLSATSPRNRFTSTTVKCEEFRPVAVLQGLKPLFGLSNPGGDDDDTPVLNLDVRSLELLTVTAIEVGDRLGLGFVKVQQLLSPLGLTLVPPRSTNAYGFGLFSVTFVWIKRLKQGFKEKWAKGSLKVQESSLFTPVSKQPNYNCPT